MWYNKFGDNMTMKKMFIIIGFLLCLFSLTSCKEISSYEDMKQVEYKKILSQSKFSASGTYYVLVHRTGCAVCESIMPEVVKYANYVQSNSGTDPIYALNKSDKIANGGINDGSSSGGNRGLGATHYNDIKLYTSPVLLKITNGEVVKLIDKKTQVLDALAALNKAFE